jgi:hypothetical protein
MDRRMRVAAVSGSINATVLFPQPGEVRRTDGEENIPRKLNEGSQLEKSGTTSLAARCLL